jgi:hypothetical protein
LSAQMTEGICAFLLHCLESNICKTHALLLLRVIVLQAPPSITASCYSWLTTELTAMLQEVKVTNVSISKASLLKHPVTRSLAWLVASSSVLNMLSASNCNHLIEAAIVERQLRQAACACLYNVAWLQSNVWVSNRKKYCETLFDTYVPVLCACLGGVLDEPDHTAQLRQLMAVNHILKPMKVSSGESHVHVGARQLLLDLELEDTLRQIQCMSNKPSGDDDEGLCQKLAAEMLRIVRER